MRPDSDQEQAAPTAGGTVHASSSSSSAPTFGHDISSKLLNVYEEISQLRKDARELKGEVEKLKGEVQRLQGKLEAE